MRKRIFSIVYMFLLTLFFTAVVSGVKALNEERILTNQQIKLQKIVLRVLGFTGGRDLPDEEVVRIFLNRVKTIDVKGETLYVGYAPDARTITGYAFPVGGPGFWGPIYGMVAVNPEASGLLGVAFYKHSETPGLGGRITEGWFTKQFQGLPLRPVEGTRKVFSLKPAGPGKAPYELDAITGATGTSRAVEAFLNHDLYRFLKEFRDSVLRG